MNRTIIAASVALVLTLAAAAPAGSAQGERVYLSGRDAESAVKWDFFCTAGRNSGRWTTIPVPACWEPLGFGTFDYGHRPLVNPGPLARQDEQGRYRTAFRVPADWRGRHVFLVFDGVMTDAEVRINGGSAGPAHIGGFYRFKYEINALLKFGRLQRNVLEVDVAKESAAASVNTAERRGDYWNFGGIFRPVWLEALPMQYLERVAIDARADGAFALDFFVGGKGRADAVTVTLLDGAGNPVGTPAAAPLGAGRVTARVGSPRTWSAETPNLYTAVVSLRQEGRTVHELRQRFGFRTVEVRPGDGIYVNGRRITLKGCNRHSFWPTTGRALSERIHRLDIETIKGMNMNAVRMSHYPPDERFLELCDELGLYVLDELAGWQGRYNTETGRKLVRDLIVRDVNHPSILFWDNGNEGGWNNELNDEFAKWDPQRRTVLHPWELFGNVNTKHYPRYKELVKLLQGGDIVMPTEFLHGLYDGGHGAGLEDYWNAMRASKTAAGGFLWSLVDEGVKRPDLGGAIDVQGNQGPDGIVGPYRQKEGSYYTIKELWSPVAIGREPPRAFDGTLTVENRYAFTNLKDCRFAWQLRQFGERPGFKVLARGRADSPDIPPGAKGTLRVVLPARRAQADALALTATDPFGREIWTWVWPLKTFKETVDACHPPTMNSYPYNLEKLALRRDEKSGALLGVTLAGKPFSLSSGPIRQAQWARLTPEWVQLDFTYDEADAPGGPVGVAFNYPEEKMLAKTWLGEGPFRVWRNRLRGGTLGVWETKANATRTGFKDWVYPEFAGYFAGVRWLKLETTEGTLTIVNPDEKAFVRVGTPAMPEKKLRMKTDVTFPAGNLAVVRDLPAIGNKFHNAAETGPQAAEPRWRGGYRGTVFLRFER